MAHFGKTLRTLMGDRHFTQREFAEKSGVTKQTVQRALSMAAPKMNQTTYRAFAEALGLQPWQLDQAWRDNTVPQQQHAQRGIPILNRAQAGFGNDWDDMGYDNGVGDGGEAWLGREHCPEDPTAFAIRVEGNSMEPELRQGDLVIFSPKAAVEGKVRDGDIVFVRFTGDLDNECTIKRMYEVDRESIQLVPDNMQGHRPRVVLKEHVGRMAKLRGVYREVK